ncbi:Fic family protein [Odoribacter sp. OttesenSCG-928-A06]|nr:Fic family protein [Odoribacter sp. OttesenSCG-928-A06]
MNISNKLSFDFQTTQRLINIIGRIDSFKGNWNAIEIKENVYLKELKRIATIESIGSSTRIEGATLTDKEVKELLNNIKITKLTSRDEQEIMGYYDTLDLIFDAYQDMPLTESNIKSLHSTLLKYSDKDYRHKGNYKQLSNKVVATYPDGSQRLIFNTTEPHLVSKELEDLLIWTNDLLHSQEIHPLIVAGTFIYEFLSIHPFQDGNGRLSRLLTTLLLLRNGYPFIQYISFENLIEQKKKEYYQVLIDGQKNRYTDNERVDKWLLFFMEALEVLTKRLEEKYNTYKTKGGYLNSRQKDIVAFIREHQPLKVGDISKSFKEISINTIKKRLTPYEK